MTTAIHRQALAARLAVLFAALAAFLNVSQGQVTFNQVTNGLVGWYPLDYVLTNGSAITTPDYLNGRDLVLSPATTGGNIVASTRPSQNATTVSNCINLSQAGGATVIYYDSKGQNLVTGGGDFLPFCNQVNATMSFWLKINASSGFQDSRFFGEADTTGGNTGPILLWGTRSDSGGLSGDKQAHFLFRQKNGSGGPAQVDSLSDGTFEIPNINNHWVQGSSFTTNTVLDGNWHLLTMTIDSNRVIDIYIDGVRDSGPPGPAFTDMYGNPSYGAAIPLTNYYYTTNLYPGLGVSNPPPNGFVRWTWNNIFKTGATVWGGFKRGGITGGLPMLVDDIAFWNRQLTTNEIAFVYTNGLTGIPISRPLLINSWTADFAEVGKGDTVTLRWNVTGALTNANSGGIVISGVGDVSSKGLSGSTNVVVNGQTTFTLSVKNNVAPDTNAVVSVKAFPGVDSGWHLIQRFDGVFQDNFDTAQGGVNGNGWISSQGDFSGTFDKWNVCTIVNSGASNLVMSPRTGYNPSASSGTGFESRGALSYAKLGSLTMTPGKTNTLFFRFSLQEPPLIQGLYTDLDFGVGLSDYNFLGPSGGLGSYGGTGGGLGPYFSIIRNGNGAFNGPPINLYAPDRDETTGTIGQTFNYTSLDPNGLQTNVNYMVWMDIENYNTHSVTNVGVGSNTVAEAQYSLWIQKQGDPTRTLLFTNFHGNRDYVLYNLVNDAPTPNLDKIFFNVGSEAITTNTPGSYINTNMIVIDDIYFSKTGAKGTIPRLFDITSIVRNPSNVVIQWDSLGSLFQTNTYSIQRKTLITDAWSTIATGLPSGGTTTTYTDTTVGAASSAYYQIAWP